MILHVHTKTGGYDVTVQRGALFSNEAFNVPRGGKTRASGAKKAKAALSADEETVLKALKDTGKANVNALSRATGLPVWKLSGVIAALEVKGVLTRTGGNFVCLI